MPRYCTITVYYIDGRKEEFYGGLHAGEMILHIYPQHGPAVHLPFANIRKYETSD